MLPSEAINFNKAITKDVLPEPDSPTMPRVCLSLKTKLISFTALMCPITFFKKPFFMGNQTLRFSTCKIGKEGDGVVDGKLRVWGIKNLRVCDASVFPESLTGNIAASCYLAGMVLVKDILSW